MVGGMTEEGRLPGGPATTEEDSAEHLEANGPAVDRQNPGDDGGIVIRRRGLRKRADTYTPGLRLPLRGAEHRSAREQAARVAGWGARRWEQARTQAPVVRDRGLEFWARRPRSRAEVDALVAHGKDEVRRQAPVARDWAVRHRGLIAGVLAVVILAGADSTLGRFPIDAPATAGVALRVPAAYPIQVQTPKESTKRYLDAINNGEHLREQAVVAAAARATLERAKAEAAAAVAGEWQDWMTTTVPGTFVLPGVGAFSVPAKGLFTSGFGARWGTFHAGIDIAGPLGSPIYAVAAGTVIDAGPAQGFGLWVRIRHDDGTISVYGHMYDFFVSVGERVPAGMQIARIGNRGDSTGPHLHFEIIQGGQRVDPQTWLAQRGIGLN